MVSLHFCHSSLVLFILNLFLVIQIIIPLLKVLNVKIFLFFNFMILFFEPYFAFSKLHFDLFFRQSQVVFQFLLSLLPFRYFISFYQHYVGQFWIDYFMFLLISLDFFVISFQCFISFVYNFFVITFRSFNFLLLPLVFLILTFLRFLVRVHYFLECFVFCVKDLV